MIDILTSLMLIFVFAVTTVLMFFVNDTINDELATTPTINETYNGSIGNRTADALLSFNYLFIPFVVVVLFVGTIITASLIPTHPVFLPVSILFLSITILVSAIVTNVYSDIMSTPDIIASANNFDIINTIMLTLPIWVTLFGGGTIIALFAKSRTSDFRA